MAAKPVWKRCPTCVQKFEAGSDRELDNLMRDHIVTTEFGRKCMSEKQLALSFKKVGNSWMKR